MDGDNGDDMQLSHAEQITLDRLEEEKGPEWDKFRARKNWYKRKNLSESEAVRKALEPLLSSDVTYIHYDDMSEKKPGPMSRVFAKYGVIDIFYLVALTCAFLATNFYTIYLQRNIYGDGIKGWLLAILSEFILMAVAMTRPKKLLAAGWKYLILTLLVGHIGLTLIASAEIEHAGKSPTLERLEKRYSQVEALLGSLPDNYVTERKTQLANLAAIEQQIKHELQINPTRVVNSSRKDTAIRLRLINLLSQLFFAHLLSSQFARMFHMERFRA